MSGEISKGSTIGTGANKKHGAISPGTIKAFIILIALAMLASLMWPTINSAMEQTDTVSSAQAENPAQAAITTADPEVKEYVAKPVNTKYDASNIGEGHFVSKEVYRDNQRKMLVIGTFDIDNVPLTIYAEDDTSIEVSKIENDRLYLTVFTAEQFPASSMTVDFSSKLEEDFSGTTTYYVPGVEISINIPSSTERISLGISYPVPKTG